MVGLSITCYQQFNPRWVTGLQAWLDGTNPANAKDNTRPTTGTTLATWADRSGHAYDFTQSTAGNRPTYNTNKINGVPAVTFNGSTTWVRAENTALATSITNLITMYSVLRPTSLTGNNFVSGTEPQTNPPRVSLLGPGATGNMIWDMGQVTNGRIVGAWGGTVNTAYIFTTDASVPGSTQRILRNTTVVQSGTTPIANTFTTHRWSVGAQDTSASVTSWFNGDIGEHLIFNTYLTTPQRNQVYQYLKAKWKIP
jgi:hypothetical protein